MAQAGIHSLLGVAVRKWVPQSTWLVPGIVLGSLLPDADNLAVAVATVMKRSTVGLHRTFTHSLLTALAVLLVFYLIGTLVKQPRWTNLGLGLAVGMTLHILLDLVIWFNGVALLWPIPSWINFWSSYTPPAWVDKLNLTAEFLFFALFFFGIEATARRQGTDSGALNWLRMWTWLQVAFFAIFTALVFTLQKGFMTPYGAVYILSLTLAIGVTIRMRATLEFGSGK